MNVIVSTDNEKILNSLIQKSSSLTYQVFDARSEAVLSQLMADDVHGIYIIDEEMPYSERMLTIIKNVIPHSAKILFGNNYKMHKDADVYIPIKCEDDVSLLVDVIMFAGIRVLEKTAKIAIVTTTKVPEIVFSKYRYDPNKRYLHLGENNMVKLTPKEGGIIAVLAESFSSMVTREHILEAVWKKTDKFSSRSLDVYMNKVRKIFAETNVAINSISKSGFVMEFERK